MDSSNFRKQLKGLYVMSLQRTFKALTLQLKKQKKKILLTLLLIAPVLFIPLPKALFDQPYATVIRSENGSLLSAKIATDEQWRFPPLDSIPEKFKIASLLYEDEYFYKHPGVNPFSLLRALYQNTKSGTVISGGSTITMQTIRMAMGNKQRTYAQKLIEILKSIKLELTNSKTTILKAYTNHAPFGGNIVGLNAASWRYYAKPPHKLSWAEAATLAVLPNNPKSIFPGKNQNRLLEKRNRLLDKIHLKGKITEEDLELYKAEAIPESVIPLPNHVPHLLLRALNEGLEGQNVITTLNYKLQLQTVQTLNEYSTLMAQKEIHNAAAIIIDIASGNTLAYVGNSNTQAIHSKDVDIISAARSPGSLLKPFLYAAAVDDHLILPEELLPDTPLFYRGFIPKNFDKQFRGVLHADQALSQSLNIPFVYLLSNYGQERFYTLLKKIGYNRLRFSPSHYGLSLILGGAESSLWELSGLYAGMARAYLSYFKRPFNLGYSDNDYKGNRYIKMEQMQELPPQLNSEGIFNIGALQATFTAMENLRRPDQESGWQAFQSAKKIAWKTGTSYGYKDAWAIGLNQKYLVGVWIGNADGEGRPDLVGVRTAAPLMFDLFSFLDADPLVQQPLEGMYQTICRESGQLSGAYCTNLVERVLTEKQIKNGKSCSYHKQLNLNTDTTYQVNSSCYSVSKIVPKNWFILPAAQTWYYKKYNPEYALPPPFLPGCIAETTNMQFQLIYPQPDTKIFIPKEQNGTQGQVVFHATHNNPDSALFWYVDHTFVGTTQNEHRLEVNALPGNHLLLLMDNNGKEIKRTFTVLE